MRRLMIAVLGAALALSPMALAGPAEARAAYSVTLAISKTTITHGSTVTLSGKVSPNARGQRVRVQRKVGSATTWTTFAKPKLSRTSRFRLTFKPGPGPVQYRVVKTRYKTRAAGTSPTRVLAGKRWRYLTDLLPATATDTSFGTFKAGRRTRDAIGNYVYYSHPHSVAVRDGGSAEWNVAAWRCTDFKTILGVRDISPPTVKFLSITVFTNREGSTFGFVDNDLDPFQSNRYQERPMGDLGFLADQKVTLVAYRNDGGTADPNAQLVYGTPQVYCNS